MPEIDEGGHAVLAPSAAERWLSCPASVRMSRQVSQPPAPSSYAEEGTAAHALSELYARRVILGTLTPAAYKKELAAWHRTYDSAVDDFAEMDSYAEAYVVLLQGKLAEHPGSQLLLEQRVPTGVPSCWGTSDAVIVSPVHVEIVDLKYGKGVQVEAEENPQLRLYGIGALEAFGDLLGEPEFVRMTVHQPRLHHTVSEDLTAAELRAWRDSILPIAEQALGHDAPFGPSDAACRWCPASGQCAAQLAYNTTMDFGTDPDVLDDAALQEALDRIPAIEAWCAAVRAFALDRIYSKGQPIPGYKVVASSGRRFIADPDGAIKALKAMGYTMNQVATTKIKGIGELETLLKGDFRLLDSFVSKSEGSPSLVTEDDGRPSLFPNDEAAKEFAE